MKYAFVGSRDYPDPEDVIRAVERIATQDPEAVIISGGARGVDSIAERAAVAHGLETLIFKADWKKFGRSAGFRRNHDIIDAADYVYAFSFNDSKGTAHSIKLAFESGKQMNATYKKDTNG